jgi:hypothetical protein
VWGLNNEKVEIVIGGRGKGGDRGGSRGGLRFRRTDDLAASLSRAEVTERSVARRIEDSLPSLNRCCKPN